MNKDKMLTFDPQNMVPKEVYKLLIGAVVPRPIAFVSTLDLNNVRNLAPFSLTLSTIFTLTQINCGPSAAWRE